MKLSGTTLAALSAFCVCTGLAIVRRLPRSARARGLFTMGAAGFALFVVIEVGYQALGTVELGALSDAPGSLALSAGLLIVGLLCGMVGLAWIETRRGQPGAYDPRPLDVAVMLAAGVGLYSFAKGLSVGQSMATALQGPGGVLSGWRCTPRRRRRRAPIVGRPMSPALLLLAAIAGPSVHGIAVGTGGWDRATTGALARRHPLITSGCCGRLSNSCQGGGGEWGCCSRCSGLARAGVDRLGARRSARAASAETLVPRSARCVRCALRRAKPLRPRRRPATCSVNTAATAAIASSGERLSRGRAIRRRLAQLLPARRESGWCTNPAARTPGASPPDLPPTTAAGLSADVDFVIMSSSHANCVHWPWRSRRRSPRRDGAALASFRRQLLSPCRGLTGAAFRLDRAPRATAAAGRAARYRRCRRPREQSVGARQHHPPRPLGPARAAA